MKCPTDGDTLLMTVRLGVEIDFCPTCRGVWLERGELSKLFEREAAAYGGPATLPAEPVEPEPVRETSAPVTRAPASDPWGARGEDRRADDHDDDDDDDDDHKRRRRSKDKRVRYDDRRWRDRHSTEQMVDSFLRDLFDL